MGLEPPGKPEHKWLGPGHRTVFGDRDINKKLPGFIDYEHINMNKSVHINANKGAGLFGGKLSDGTRTHGIHIRPNENSQRRFKQMEGESSTDPKDIPHIRPNEQSQKRNLRKSSTKAGNAGKHAASYGGRH